jgi:hypothetical protein
LRNRLDDQRVIVGDDYALLRVAHHG